MNGKSYVYFKNSPSVSLLFFRPKVTFDVLFKKKAYQKEFYSRVAFISYSLQVNTSFVPKMRES